jgi:hypothetical protein
LARRYNPATGLVEDSSTPNTFYPVFGSESRSGGFIPGTRSNTQGSQNTQSPPPMFDYFSALQSDPVYQQDLADLGAANVSDRAGLKAARQRAIVQFGEAPDFTTLDQSALGEGFADDIDETTRALAQRNTQEGLSVAARITKQHEDNLRQLTNYLSSRGLLRSGEAGYRFGEESLALKRGQYDARQKALDFLNSYNSAYLQGLAQRQAAMRASAGGAFDRANTIYGGVGAGGGPAPAAPVPQPPTAQTLPTFEPITTPAGQYGGYGPYDAPPPPNYVPSGNRRRYESA